MTWLTIDGKTLDLLGGPGGEAFRDLLSKFRDVTADGVIDERDAAILSGGIGEFLQASPYLAPLREALERRDGLVGGIVWLARPFGSWAESKGRADRRKTWGLIDWSGNAGDSSERIEYGLNFGAEAELFIEAVPAEEDSGDLTCRLGVRGALKGGAEISLKPPIDAIDRIGFLAEAALEREICYLSPVASAARMTGRAIADALEAAATSPVDLAELDKKFAAGELRGVSVAGEASRHFAASDAIDLPLGAGGVVAGGSLNLSASVARRYDRSFRIDVAPAQAMDPNHRVVVRAAAQEARDRGYETGLELAVRFKANQVLKELIALSQGVSDAAKGWAETLAEISDMETFIHAKAGEALDKLLPSKDLAEALSDSLLDAKAGKESLQTLLVQTVLDEARPWAGDAQARIGAKVDDWLDESGIGGLSLKGQSLKEHAGKALEDLFEEISAKLKERLEDFADKNFGDDIGNAADILNQLGAQLTQSEIATLAQDRVKILRRLLDQFLETAERARKVLEAASAVTVGAKFAASGRALIQGAAEYEILFNPDEDKARQIFRSAVLSPRATLSGLMSADPAPDGVLVSRSAELVRLREAVDRSVALSLCGLNYGGGRLLSSDAHFARIGGQVYFLGGAVQARRWRENYRGERQSVIATYLAPHNRAPDRLPDEVKAWRPFKDGAVSAARDQPSALSITVRQEDSADFTLAEMESLIESFTQAGLIDRPVKAAALSYAMDHLIFRDSPNLTLEASLELNSERLETLSLWRNDLNGARKSYLQEMWSVLSVSHKESVAGAVARGDRFAGADFVDHVMSQSEGHFRSARRSSQRGTVGADRVSAKRPYDILLSAKISADRFAALIEEASALRQATAALKASGNGEEDSALARAHIEEALENIRGVLATWTVARVNIAPFVEFLDSIETVAAAPLTLMRSLRAACGESAPQLVLTLEDESDGRMRQFSNAFQRSAPNANRLRA